MNARSSARRSADPDIATVAAAIADPARAAMLLALLDGRALAASNLASLAGVSPQSASGHLAKLRDAGLVVPAAAGRNRLYRIASLDVAHAIESLAVVAPRRPIVSLRQNIAVARMRDARSCYDHLAGRLAVACADRLVERGHMTLAGDAFDVTRTGERFFARFGVDLAGARAERRHFARTCLDLTERRGHVAGSLGAALLQRFLGAGWLERRPSERSLDITGRGRDGFSRVFDVVLEPATAGVAR